MAEAPETIAARKASQELKAAKKEVARIKRQLKKAREELASLDLTTAAKMLEDILEDVPDTAKAIEAMVTNIEPPFKEVLQDIADTIEEVAEQSTKVIKEALDATLSGDLSPSDLDKAQRAADALAKLGGDDLAQRLVASDLKAMITEISKGLDEGLDIAKISRRLDLVKGLDSQRAARVLKLADVLADSDLTVDQIAARLERFRTKMLNERKKSIAATEARRLTEEARRLEADALGAKFKTWITTGDDRVSDDCQDNEAAGPIPIKDVFPGGVEQPPQHTNCRCSLAYGTSAAQRERMEAHSKERAERTATAKAADEAA